MDIRLDGRVALITGGSEGLGKGMALRFAESGADIAILARRPDALNAAKAEIETVSKGKVITLPCDLLDGAATERRLQKQMRHSARSISSSTTQAHRGPKRSTP